MLKGDFKGETLFDQLQWKIWYVMHTEVAAWLQAASMQTTENVELQTGSREVQKQDAQPGVWKRNDGCSQRLQAGALALHIKAQHRKVLSGLLLHKTATWVVIPYLCSHLTASIFQASSTLVM